MKMSRYFVCCEQCFEAIGKRNTKAAKAWMEICAAGMTSGEIFSSTTRETPEVRALELMGFIVTTDRGDSIAIKVKGHMKGLNGDHFFCLKGGRHE